MSTEIKPGQVWAWRARQGDPFTIDRLDGDMAEYHYGKRVANTTYSAPRSLIQRTADLVTDATPAPSKVAPKDRHPEQLARFRKQVHWATDLKRGDVIVSVEAHNAVTVEREEPAPEPEPELPTIPGSLIKSEAGDLVFLTKAMWLDQDHDERNPSDWAAPWTQMVVIDPEAVDMDALTTTFHNASHYGVDLPLEGAAYLARLARTFFVGGESR